MPLSKAHTKAQSRRLAVTLCVGLLPLLLGSPLIYWQAGKVLDQQAHDRAEEARELFEEILDTADTAARSVIDLSGGPCDDVDQALRRQVTINPYLRSVNLAYDGELYCTSLSGPFKEPEQLEYYSDGQLRLMPGNDTTPDRAVLIYRLADAPRAVLIGIDGLHLTKVLQLARQKAPLQLVIGDAYMGADGQVRQAPLPPIPVAQTDLHSERYPLHIRAGYAKGAQWHLMQTQYLSLLVLLLLLGIMASVAVQWLGLRANSPRRELERALAAGEFLPYYQPLVGTANDQWSGVEVLMRWQQPEQGLVPPGQFIPLAEESGLIVPMTRHLMRRVRDELLPHADRLPEAFHVGINITADHCRDLVLIDECRAFLDDFPPGRIVLTLELTERQMIDSTTITEQLFSTLRDMGVRIAIDDFGTGHSSLAYLRAFQVNYLKIDQSFVAMIGTDALSHHLLENIVDLSTRLDLGIVAEGVETDEQSDYLRRRGVQYLQGYLYAKPMPIAALLTTLQKGVPS